MEKIVEDLNDPVRVSTLAAAVSAVCALLTFLFSRKRSRRDMVDILKIEILRLVSSVQGREVWITEHRLYLTSTGGRYGPTARRLVGLLGKRYKKKRWMMLVLVAIEELRREGYQDLLGG